MFNLFVSCSVVHGQMISVVDWKL